MCRRILFCLLLPLSALAGCSRQNGVAPPPKVQEVQVSSALERSDIVDYEVFTGRTEACDRVDLRARVTGYLVVAPTAADEGKIVEKDHLLFVIDPRPFKAAVESAEATLAQAEARASRTEADFDRARTLLAQKGIGREDYDKYKGDRDEAEAALKKARADLKRSRLDLQYTEIKAPFKGRIGRRMIDPGNLVKADDTILTTIVALEPTYAYFDVDERTLLRQLLSQGALETARNGKVPILIGLSDEDGYPHPGTVNFVDNRVDPNTGTMWMRGIFVKPSRTLAPGMFIRVRFPVSEPHRATLVAEQAISTDQGQKFVYVIGEGNKAEYRQVQVGRLHDGLRVIKDGLKPGEHVVVSGLQRVRANTEVIPKEVPMPIRSATSSNGKDKPGANNTEPREE